MLDGLVAYEFEREMWKRIQEAVKKVSQVQPTLELWIHIITKDYETRNIITNGHRSTKIASSFSL